MAEELEFDERLCVHVDGVCMAALHEVRAPSQPPPVSAKPGEGQTHPLAAKAGEGEEDGLTKRRYLARFVRAGRTRAAGNQPGEIEITAPALEKAWEQGLFNGKAVFIDHAPENASGGFENPSLRNLVGVTRATHWNSDELSVEGVIEIYASARPVSELLDEILSQGEAAPDVGLSLVFYPLWEERKVVGVRHVESIDLVFQPAAEGRLLQALNAAPGVRRSNEGLRHQKKEATMSEGLEPTREAITDLPVPGEAGQWLPAIAKAGAQALLQASGLPAASRERLAAQNFATPAEVETAIAAERTYLAQLAQENVVQIGGHAPRRSRWGWMGWKGCRWRWMRCCRGASPRAACTR